MKKLLLFVPILFLSLSTIAQYLNQSFDGADTSASNSIFITLDTSSSNVWQIGPPQKNFFDSPSSSPNVLITDTINPYPDTTNSFFTFGYEYTGMWFGILAIQWMQKLDMDPLKAGGIIEYSSDQGTTWTNVITSPFTYSFYGYQNANQINLYNGEPGLSGTDTTWRNIWLCFDISWLSIQDTIDFRFTLISEDSGNTQEGWMIDNFVIAPTIIHTVNEEELSEYMIMYPSPTDGIVNIRTEKTDGFHIIESLEVYDQSGKLCQSFQNVPTKFFVDLSQFPDGMYMIKAKTNLHTVTKTVILQH